MEVLLDVHQRVENDVCELSVVEMREIGGGIGERLVHEFVHELEDDGEKRMRVEILIGSLVELHLCENDDDVRDEGEIVRRHGGQEVIRELLHLLDHVFED